MTRGYRLRFGEERLDYCELVLPCNAAVLDVYESVALGLPEEAILALYDFVCRNIDYPFTAQGEPNDRHHLDAFLKCDMPFLGPKYRVSITQHDFWQYPQETLGWGKNGRGIGDCDDSSVLLCSLLRCLLPPERVCVAVGDYEGDGHAWVLVTRGDYHYILEPTHDTPPPDPWLVDPGYHASFFFNDTLKWGSPPPSGRAGRNELRKLQLIAAHHGHPTKGSR